MIIQTPTSYFDCVWPRLEENEAEEFFYHPTLEGIYCNQIGILYLEDIYSQILTGYVNISATKKILGRNEEIVWECYHNRLLLNDKLDFKDGNHLNRTRDNLYIRSRDPYKRKVEIRSLDNFWKNSIDYLIELEKKWDKIGVSPDYLHEILQISDLLKSKRKNARFN